MDEPDDVPEDVPFPSSLCHRCSAPPRYVRTQRGSTFIMCPVLLNKYPRQPVVRCASFRAKHDDRCLTAGAGAKTGSR